jgi:hypothetical protein
MTAPRLAISLTLLVFAVRAESASAQATTDRSRTATPFTFDGVNPCNGELITLSGELIVTLRATVDATGATHFTYTLIPSNVRGTGASGATYRAVGGEREHTNVAANLFPFTDTFTSMFNLVSSGKAPNFLSNLIGHVTIAADGTVRSFVDHVVQHCGG